MGYDFPVPMDLLHENEVVNANSENDAEASIDVSAALLTRAHAKTGVQLLPERAKQSKSRDPDIPLTTELFEVPDNISDLQGQDDVLKS